MKLRELMNKGIRKVRFKFWNEDSYLELYMTDKGKYGPWAKLFDEHGQRALGLPLGSQKILLLDLDLDDDRWEEFTEK